MTRPSDRYPLAVFDPVAGDPVAVRAAGEEYVRVAARIEAAAADLRTIAAATTTRGPAIPGGAVPVPSDAGGP